MDYLFLVRTIVESTALYEEVMQITPKGTIELELDDLGSSFMYELFSADDHVVEHATVWADRLPRRLRDEGPHVVEVDGREWWESEGRRVGTPGLNAVAGRPPEQWSADPTRFSDMRPGCYDPKERAKDILPLGILASLCYPTVPKFGGALFLDFEDEKLADLCVSAYNDFILDEWCPGGPPGLFVPMIIVQLWDPLKAAEEVRRYVEKGARAVCLPESALPLGLPSYHDEVWAPLWRTIEEAGVPVCMHALSSGYVPPAPPEIKNMYILVLASIGVQLSVADMILGPVCRKFPKLKLVYAEGGIGFLPPMLERADRQYKHHRLWTKCDESLPSDIFRRNMYLCTVEEPMALRVLRQQVGIDKILWESDYPHADGVFPYAQEVVAEQMAGIPDAEVQAILHGNAERIFGWKMADRSLAENADPIASFDWQLVLARESAGARHLWKLDADGVRRCLHTVVGERQAIVSCNERVYDDDTCAAGHHVSSGLTAAAEQTVRSGITA
jgi:predicted TIM-barrel fold metal-dependent hydrolase